MRSEAGSRELLPWAPDTQGLVKTTGSKAYSKPDAWAPQSKTAWSP